MFKIAISVGFIRTGKLFVKVLVKLAPKKSVYPTYFFFFFWIIDTTQSKLHIRISNCNSNTTNCSPTKNKSKIQISQGFIRTKTSYVKVQFKLAPNGKMSIQNDFFWIWLIAIKFGPQKNIISNQSSVQTPLTGKSQSLINWRPTERKLHAIIN